jgi:dienelactone hydrolase
MVYAPPASAVTKRGFDTASGGDFNSIDYLVMSGRAVVYPVYSGTYERNAGQTTVWPTRTRAYQDWMVQVVNDARRTVDYLESRTDIRHDTLAFLGASWGASFAPRILAQEKRLKAAVLTDGGFSAAVEIPPEVDSVNYVPRITQPLLMINGDADFIYPVETAQRPFFERLGTPREQKRKVTLRGGHYIIQQQRNQVIREVLNWLDERLGPVEASDH